MNTTGINDRKLLGWEKWKIAMHNGIVLKEVKICTSYKICFQTHLLKGQGRSSFPYHLTY